LRRAAKNERVLLHYNGHGVPKPTSNGELWVFDFDHTQYIPLSVIDLKKWIGKPSLIVLDCSGAGAVLPVFASNNNSVSGVGTSVDASVTGGERDFLNNVASNTGGRVTGDRGDNGLSGRNAVASAGTNSLNNTNSTPQSANYSATNNNSNNNNIINNNTSNITQQRRHGFMSPSNSSYFTTPKTEEEVAKNIRDIIVLCPTSASETLPLNPELPADLFTSCLTTPIPIALRWFVFQNPLSCSNLPPDNVDLIPGELPDRKTPLGELNWIFTAITDTIAWSVLPHSLFQRLFRQDLLVASMFRNFLLADRILRALNCTPTSYPALPSTCDHPLWQAWDLTVETCLSCLMRDGVMGDLGNNNKKKDKSPNNMNDGNSSSCHRSVSHSSSSDNKDVQLDDEDDKDDCKGSYKGGGKSIGGNSINTAANNKRVEVRTTQQEGTSYNISAPFFAEQLTAFEIWLDFAAMRIKEGGTILMPPLKQYEMSYFGDMIFSSASSSPILSNMHHPVTDIESPEQLPIVLQVILSPAHRVRALVLLERFHHLGPSAVNIALSVGIFPYVLKLLQSHEYKHILVGIWSKILEFDISCQVDLVEDGALRHFVNHLHWGLPELNSTSLREDHKRHQQVGTTPKIKSTPVDVLGGGGGSSHYDAACQRTMAAAILSAICYKYPQGQTECVKKNAYGACVSLLKYFEIGDDGDKGYNQSRTSDKHHKLIKEHLPPQFRMWICIFLGVFTKDHALAQSESFNSNLHLRLFKRLGDDSSDVRAAVCFALGSLIVSEPTPSVISNSIHGGGGLGSGVEGLSTTRLDRGIVPTLVTSSQCGTTSFHKTQSGLDLNSPFDHQSNPLPFGQQSTQLPFGHQLNPRFDHQSSTLLGHQSNTLPGDNSWKTESKQNSIIPPLRPTVSSVLEPVRFLSDSGTSTENSVSLFQKSQNTPQSNQMFSVFENRLGVAHDLTILENIVKASKDACPTVRYEAIIVIGKVVGKYLMTFAAVADKVAVVNIFTQQQTKDQSSEPDQTMSSTISVDKSQKSLDTSIPMPEGVDDKIEGIFTNAWKRLRSMHNSDPHPNVSNTATNIVRFVNEHVLVLKPSLQRAAQRRQANAPENASGSYLALSDKKSRRQSFESHRSNSEMDLGFSHHKRTAKDAVGEGDLTSKNSQYLGRPLLRRNYSVLLGQNDFDQSYLINASPESQGIQKWLNARKEQYKKILPQSKFYEWKKAEFKQNGKKNPYDERCNTLLDPLSREGAIEIYRSQRNMNVDKAGNELAERFASLGPKAPKAESRLGDVELLVGDFEDEKTPHDAALLEAEMVSKKEALHLKESNLLIDHGKTYMLRFHPYENILVACDDSNTVSIWDTKNSVKVNNFNNENSKNTRMTSILWINERNNSLLLVGCDDGSVRAWDGIIGTDCAHNHRKPSLATAFFAMPELVSGQRGSGLIMEWQESHSRLITSGSTKLIRCWDLELEKCVNSIESNVNSCLTAMTVAWDNIGHNDVQHSPYAAGFSGMGPDVLFAGYGDGTLKVFDLRLHQQRTACKLQTPELRRLSQTSKQEHYSEHSNWIVNTSFMRYGDNCELVSGCVAGGIKFWDLRLPSSIRTVDIQRSPMTALACHPRIPLFATGSTSNPRIPLFTTGSRAQYIKLFTPNGDILQVIRNHEQRQKQRIGPVSCLAFHPSKLVLAAGATDGIISLHHAVGK